MKMLILIALFFCSFTNIAQEIEDRFETNSLYVKAYPGIIHELDSLNTYSFPSKLSGFDTIKVNAGIYRIELTFNSLIYEFAALNNIFTIHFTNSDYRDTLLNYLLDDSTIIYAEKVPKYRFEMIPSDVYYANQWNLDKINAEAAWDMCIGKRSVKIAIVDDAIQISHPDLQKKIWVNQEEIPNQLNIPDLDSNGLIDVLELFDFYGVTSIDSLYQTSLFNNIDDDNNFYKDDLFGWDATNFGDNNPSPPYNGNVNNFSHGTHIAGIAAAETSNLNPSNGVASIGWNSSIIPIKIKNDDNFSTYANSPISGLCYALKCKPDIINMSWGSIDSSITMQNYLSLLDSLNIILVAAAGNSGLFPDSAIMPHYPAAYESVIAVGASDTSDLKANFSCYSSYNELWIDVIAPGTNILSTVFDPNILYEYKSGTSMSSPLVSGLISLMLAYCPSCTPLQIEHCLFEGCDPMTQDTLFNLDPTISRLGYGRINAYNSLTCLQNQPVVANFSTNQQFICSNSALHLDDLSEGFITNWHWFCSDTLLHFNNDTIQNPILFLNGFNGLNFEVTLIVENTYIGSSDTVSMHFEITEPSANVTYQGDTLSACNDESTFFNIEFLNANPPFIVSYLDNFGNYYVDTLISNLSIIPVSPASDTITSYSLVELESFDGCFIALTGMVSFASNQCDCKTEIVNNNITFGKKGRIQFENSLNSNEGGYLLPSNFQAMESTATLSDTYGDLYFYASSESQLNSPYPTYVHKVWDKLHQVMPNGDSIIGNFSSNQGLLILPKSFIDSTYYLFSLSAADSGYYNADYFHYSVIDLKEMGNSTSQSSPLGDVTVKNIPITQNGYLLAEKMTWVKHGILDDTYWLVAHSKYGNYFSIYLVDEDTVQYHHTDTIGHFCISYDCAGDLKANSKGNLIAANYFNPGIVELYSFNNNTGYLGFLDQKLLTKPYSLEFSPNSAYLYVTGFHMCFRFDIISNTLLNLAPLFICNNICGLRTTPDKTRIIYGVINQNFVGSINNPNDINPIIVDSSYVLPPNAKCDYNFPQPIPSSPTQIELQYLLNSCSLNGTGEAAVAAWSSCNPISYLWNDPSSQTGPIAINLTPGVYSVTATDACGCTSSLSVTIEHSILEITDVELSPGCEDMDDAYIDIEVETNSPPLSFNWSLNVSFEDLYNVSPGIYSVTITNSANCSIVSSFNTGSTLNVTPIIQNACFAQNNGSIFLEITGGLPEYTIIWSSGESTILLDSLYAGYYTVAVYDANECIQKLLIEVPEYPDIQYTLQYDSTVCNCESDILLTLDTSQYYVDWSVDSITNVCPGTYSFQITNFLTGCSISESFLIQYEEFMLNAVSVEMGECSRNGYIHIPLDSLNGTPNYSFFWFDAHGNLISTNNNLDSISPSIYDLIVYDSLGCVDSMHFNISTLDISTLNLDLNNCGCYAICTGQAVIGDTVLGQPLNNFFIEWSNGVIGQDSIYDLCVGDHWVSLEDSLGCTGFKEFSISGGYHLDYNIIEVINNSCQEVIPSSVTLVTNGTPPIWLQDTSYQIDSIQFFLEGPGYHTLVIVDSNSCYALDSIYIDTLEHFVMEIDSITIVDCNYLTGSVIHTSILGQGSMYSYLWSTGETTSYFTINTNENYYVTITDENNCSIIDTVSVDFAQIQINNTVELPTCPTTGNGKIILDIQGGNPPYSYSWNNNSSTSTIENLLPGQYFVTISDAFGCTQDANINLYEYRINLLNDYL